MLPTNLLLQNRYRIIRLIGQGGMGAVYAAFDQRLDHTVALKQIMRGDVVAFEREARLLARLRHPGLPHVTDHFVDEVGQFLVMEYIPSDDLATALLRQQTLFPPEQVLAWADQLLVTLTYLHAQMPPILHRDIKPANLKVTQHNRLVLLDFGLAKDHTGLTSDLQKSAAGYTLAYAAPEQIRGEGTDVRSDLYSAAATIYHLLTGSRPPDAIQRAMLIADGQPDPLFAAEQAIHVLSPLLAMILQKAMALNPTNRFADAATMRIALAGQDDTTQFVSTGGPPPAQIVATPAPRAVPNNLPERLTSLVGRATEIAELCQALARPEVRLLTLTGAGGSGKTSLALAVARTFLEVTGSPAFPDGVYFVNLAPIQEPALVVSTVAQVLGIKEEAGKPLLTSLQTYAQARRLLLVLDNFEQIVTAASLISDLLTTCAELKILVTSREVLRVRGEHEFLVPLLALPTSASQAALAELSQFAAVQLFVERAQALKPGFVLDASNAAAVAEIVTRLDGLPLAIELAATHSKLLSPPAILARLQDRFKLLRSNMRDLPDRQRTLRAAIDWSYDLLTPDEQTLFRRLAVFVGGRTLEAIEVVCNSRDHSDLPPLDIDVLDGLAALIDKSLIYQTEGVDGEPRFMLLVTIYEYADERLEESKEGMWIRNQHANFFLNLAEQAEAKLRGPNQVTWLERVELEHDNFRAALRWANEYNENEIALRLSSALGMFWYIRSKYLEEGRTWLHKALVQSKDQRIIARAEALRRSGWLASLQGDSDQAAILMEEGLLLNRALKNERGVARTLNTLGTVAKNKGDYQRSRELHEEGLAIFRKLDNKLGIAASLNNLSNLFFDQKDYAQAVLLYKEALALYKAQGDRHGYALAATNLGMTLFFLNDYEQATAILNEALLLRRELDDAAGIAQTLNNLGCVVQRRNEYEQSSKLYKESLCLRQKIMDKQGIAECLESFADLNCILKFPEKAVRLYSRANVLRADIGNPLTPLNQEVVKNNLALLRTTFGEENFSRAWAAGQSMTLEQAIDYALT